MAISAAIYSSSGPTLTIEERAFFRETQPFGFILFARNIADPEQVRALCAGMREAAGHDAPILIDQEGGRVQRLRPPHWPAHPPGRAYANPALSREQQCEAARLGGRLIAHELREVGIDVDCLPCLDVPVPGAHDVIGDRAYGEEPQVVIDLGRAAAQGLIDGGVLPVIKHIPGHGRAGVDSHLALPVVDASAENLAATDFAPFKALRDMPMAMTAHVVYTALDAGACATLSRRIISDIIRGEIGFDGLLMSDDVGMQALAGDFADRARGLFAAGCDLALHCSGDIGEMRAVAGETPVLAGQSLIRAEAALAMRKAPKPGFDPVDARVKRDALLAVRD
jgi:beta-N-acetylhexosaminidase